MTKALNNVKAVSKTENNRKKLHMAAKKLFLVETYKA